MAALSRRVVVTHPAADRYGSDLQVLESVSALVDRGWQVTFVVPTPGPLLDLVEGAEVRIVKSAVLRKSSRPSVRSRRWPLSPWRVLMLLGRTPVDLLRASMLLRELRPDFLYVNTITVPIWMLAARLCGIPLLTHVHEAENDHPRPIRLALTAPLLFSQRIVVNSQASARAITDVMARLTARTAVVYNGVPDPGDEREPASAPPRIAYIGRLSPRKGVDTALEAVARLRAEGVDVCLDICGSTFPGYEDYEAALRARAAQPDLADRVRFLGYVRPLSGVLSRSSLLVMPSRYEPFGNVAVEALLARCPVVATRVQGLQEVVKHEETGLLVPPDDPGSLAQAIAQILQHPDRARARAEAGRRDALARFSVAAYRDHIGRLAEDAVS